MLDISYLQRGLDALSRAHEFDYFADGHRGGAIISAYYFCREEQLPTAAVDCIAALIDEHWSATPLCAPFADEAPDAAGIEQIIAHVERSLGSLRQAGHNVILPALALKAFAELPSALTPARVDGICTMIDSFTVMDAVPLSIDKDVPDLSSPRALAQFSLRELLKCTRSFDGHGQGWSGHLLTYARALLDLRALGHEELAAHAECDFKLYINRIRMGPLKTDKVYSEHAESAVRPHELAYWQKRRQSSPSLGHLFKYPYGFYGLVRMAQDEALINECWREAYRIF
ncbi:MAG: hypothetical protein ACKVJG_09600 [Candidatus Latescibacterota bacterium]|jgi:hypothetical protein